MRQCRSSGRGASRAIVAGLALAAVALAPALGTVRADGPAKSKSAIEYNRDIRPILAENCFACHGPDSASRKADLRLDRRDAAVQAGAIAPGDVEQSELLHRIFSSDRDEVMPPPAIKKNLTAAQKDRLKQWIVSGAEYQPHWSLIAPTRPAPPTVKHEARVKNPIDRFVLSKLEARGLSPAPEADRLTLARRVSLDLTGLPPEPRDVDAFVADTSPDAYEKYVDRLLGSDRWGEHRARYWLDVARYADTHGIHFDNYRENWVYRDWVINAFNRNMPFDQFTLEQLAGDLLPGRTVDQQVASGFNRCNITTNEGGTIPEEYLVFYTRDRTETASQVWMGLTTGCAVCHDHKFDPISQKEFYQLAAFFNNTTQAAMDGNIKDTPPTIFVPRSDDRPKWDALARDVEAAKGLLEARRKSARADFTKTLAALTPGVLSERVPADGLRLLAPLSEGTGSSTQVTTRGAWRQVELGAATTWEPGHVSSRAIVFRAGVKLDLPEAGDFDRDQAFSYGAWVRLPKNPPPGAVFARMMDDGNDYRGWDLWIENGKVGTHIIHKWPDDALKVVSRDPLKPGEWHHLFVTYDGKGQASGVTVYVDGKAQPVDVPQNTLKNTIRTSVPFRLAQRNTGSRLNGLGVQDVRLYDRALPPADVAALASSTRSAWLASKAADKRTEAETNELFDAWLTIHDAEFPKLAERLVALERDQAGMKSRGTIAHVMQERGESASAFILFRGEYDKRRDPVKAATPSALPPLPSDLPKNRLGLARWLLRPEHPLTARVTVNRFWQEVFGTGLVRTAGDFGVSGELPSHPELLDWLAVEFRESGWDVKRLFKRLVTSSAYRQSAASTAEKLEKDAHNRLLSRGPRFRMDAEMVRDSALASSGLLVKKIGGPSVKPYQPEGVWEAVAMIGSNTRDYRADSGDGLYRRSLYTFWKRAAPPASMEIFNAPSREVCTVRRERTNTPLQALVTLNDPQFVESARRLAERTLKDGGSTVEDRLDYLARRLLARPLRPEEEKVVSASLADLSAFYQGHPADSKRLISVGDSKPDAKLDPATLAAWTMLSNEMLNLDEVLNK
jgi:mono/diheme cytochrome c family protein